MENKRKITIYVAGAYTAKTKKEIEKNIQKARRVALSVWNAGFSAICPHLNTYHFDDKNRKLKHSDFMEGDIAILEHCDGILMMKG